MQGHGDIIEVLNDVLTAELTAINDNFVDAKMFQNWGFKRLASQFREESIDEMKDADSQRLNKGIARCVELGDNGSRELLENILEGEEEHADWLEAQLELIRQVGDSAYLAQQIHD